MPIFVGTIKLFVRQLVVFGWFDFLIDKIAQDIFVGAILLSGFDDAFGRDLPRFGLPCERAGDCPVEYAWQFGGAVFPSTEGPVYRSETGR